MTKTIADRIDEDETARPARLEGVAVLQVIPALEAGGAERTAVEVALAVAAAGGRSIVASAGGRMADHLSAGGVRHVRLPLVSKNPATMLTNIGRLARLVRAEGVAIVHARSRAPAWSALGAARLTGAAFVTTYHGAYGQQSAAKRFYNSSMVRGDVVIANSDFTAAAITVAYPWASERLRTIPRGADLGAFDPATVAEDRVRAVEAAWGIERREQVGRSRRIRFLLPARLTSWKGHFVAVEAVERIRADASDVFERLDLVLMGDAQGRDGYVEELRAAIAKAGLGDAIRIAGHCDDMPAAYRASDIVIAPSTRPEAFGRVAVEAGAMGAPVIASRHGGFLETVVDGETGRLTPAGDSVALALAMVELARSAESELSRLGQRAQARVKRLFSVEAMTRATIDAYRDLAPGRRSRDR